MESNVVNRSTRSRSTMAQVYENSSLKGLLASGPAADMLNNDSAAEREWSAQSPGPPTASKQLSSLPGNIPQQIKLNITTAQLLQLKGEDFPDAPGVGVSVALKNTGERLELIVNPVPTVQSFGSQVYHMLGIDGAKQPTVLYGTIGYVLDYLVASHAGGQKLNFVNFIPQSLRRPSMNISAMRQGANGPNPRTIVSETLADWVIHLWDAFLLTYHDACTTLDLVKELVSRWEKSIERRPGASERPVSMSVVSGALTSNFVQTAFETSDGHIIVARMTPTDDLTPEAKTSRSARAVLAWMGLLKENRSMLAMRTNTLLFILHWLRTCNGPVDLAESKESYDRLYECMTEASSNDNVELSNIAKMILKDLKVIEDCSFDKSKVQSAFGIDLNGELSKQTADYDQYRIRELCLCFVPRPLPVWFLKSSETIYRRSAALVASEMTLMTYDLVYRHISPLMLLNEATRHEAVPVQDMIRLFRIFSYWPLTCIFEEGLKLPARMHRLTFFIEVAENLRKLSNFHAFFAVMGGLTQPLITWLWQALPQTSKFHKKFEELKRAISSYGDYRVYKADLSHCNDKSRIPFLGVTNRNLSLLESEPTHCPTHHTQLYYFARQVARSAAINEFLGGQRHPYVAKSGYTYAIAAGPPGPSPFQLHAHGVVIGSKHAQSAPKTVWNGTYSTLKLTGDIRTGVLPQVVTGPNFSGGSELEHDEDLMLLLAFHISLTLTEEAVKEMSTEAKSNSMNEAVVVTLEEAGFM